MSNINLALDDIIAKTKKINKKLVGGKMPAKSQSISKKSEKINMSLDQIIAKTKNSKKSVGLRKSVRNQTVSKKSSKITVRKITRGIQKKTNGRNGAITKTVAPSGKGQKSDINPSLDDIIAKNKVNKKAVGGKMPVRNQSTSMKSPKSSGRKIGGGINKKRNVGKGRAVTKTVIASGKKDISDINLSLDDIIAKNKINKNSVGPKKSSKNQNLPKRSPNTPKRVFGGIEKKKNNGGNKKSNEGNVEEVTKTEPTPSPKWIKNAVSIRTFAAPVVNTNQIVRVNVSNLPATVNTADLQEIFSAYSIVSASVHYGENKEHLGTGEVTMKKNDAMKALADLKGIAVDGSTLSFAIVARGAGRSIFDRVQMAKKVTAGAIQKRSVPQKIVKKVIGKRQPLKKSQTSNKIATKKQSMTEEELNAELDSYMAKPEIKQ